MEAVLNYIITYAPVIIAILSEIGVVAVIFNKISAFLKTTNAAVEELKQSSEYKSLKNQMKLLLEENIELKKQLNVVLEEITRVKVKNETVKNNTKK